MNHNPHIREGTGPDAVLLIHGIAGSPKHFRELIPVIPREFSVYNILLDGHNGTPKDFGASSMKKWKAQFRETLETLFSRHRKVVIVGHSMGTLFAIQAAMDHPARIPALFLLNVPTRPRVSLRALAGMIQLAFGTPRSVTARAMQADTDISLSSRVWEYFGWTPRMLELLRECRRIRKQIPRLSTPTVSFLSLRDELVSTRAGKDLCNPHIQNVPLTGSGHFCYSRNDTLLLQTHLRQMLEDLTIGKSTL